MEYMSQYDCSIHYISGDNNCVADALSQLPDSVDQHVPIASIFEIKSDPQIMEDIKKGYHEDPWCQALAKDLAQGFMDCKLNISSCNGLIFIGERLIIPKYKDLHENLFLLAHDDLGHFGANKTYGNLREAFYWPNMWKDLINAYVPSCVDCQRNKNLTSRPKGPLHPLQVPDKHFDSVAIDFIGPLPKDDGFDCIVTMTDRLGADVQIIACNIDMMAEDFVVIFFNRWFCENGCPLELITDRNKLFVSRFWKALMKLSDIKHKMSTAFHPQTDGTSERTNKTVVQALRFHVERNQSGWAKALPKIRFDIMNTVNVSMGYSPFMLKSAHSPCLIPPLMPAHLNSDLSIHNKHVAGQEPHPPTINATAPPLQPLRCLRTWQLTIIESLCTWMCQASVLMGNLQWHKQISWSIATPAQALLCAKVKYRPKILSSSWQTIS
jgi:hypothetical protein